MATHSERAASLGPLIRAVNERNLIHDDSPNIDLFDLDRLEKRLKNVLEHLPDWTHGVAIKACPLSGVLRQAQKLGFGAECASMGEVKHAIELGFDPAKIIYDSPVKTKTNLEIAIKQGIYFNLDNVDEILKVDELLKTSCQGVNVEGRIGVRVNPVVGGGKVAILSTAGKTSKFGLLMVDECEQKLLDLYKQYSFLNGLHMHVGSMGMDLSQIVQGARQIIELAEKINKQAGYKQITVLDVGGGVANDYHSESDAVDFSTYKKEVLGQVPELLQYRVLTEFGRSIFTKPGISVSKIETVKDWGDRPVALCHFGSNQFVREVYTDIMFHHLTILNEDGSENNSEQIVQDIGGPLCFQGDYIAKESTLPKMKRGDFIVMHDTGGYTHALYSRYNSIQSPAVYGYKKNENGNLDFYLLKERESYEAVSAFWVEKNPKMI
jgi:diaminopimelate decarboxylase